MKIICTKALIHIYSFLLFTSYFSLIYAQAPDTLWTRTYCGPDSSSHVIGRAVLSTSDGGYIIAGSESSTGYGNVFIIKTDSVGDTLWTRSYGPDSSTEDVWDIILTNDSGFVMIGQIFWPSIDKNVYVLKINSQGDSLWAKTYGGPRTDAGFSIYETEDGGLIMTGYTKSFSPNQRDDIYIIRTDSIGDTLWTKTYGGELGDRGYSITYTADSCYMIVGMTSSYGMGSSDVHLIKINRYGDSLWAKTYGGVDYDDAYAIENTPDQKYIIVGQTWSMGQGNCDGYLLKVDENGDTLWTNTVGGIMSDYCHSIQPMANGGFIIAGYTYSYGPRQENAYLVCTDSLGNTVGYNVYGGDNTDQLFSIKPTTDGNFVAVGRSDGLGPSRFGVWLFKITLVSGVTENNYRSIIPQLKYMSIVDGPIVFPGNKIFRIFDITGREIHTINPAPGIYFIEVDGEIRRKVIKIR